MNDLQLIYNEGFRWVQHQTVFFKGYFFDQKEKLWQGSEAAGFFKNASSISEMEEILKPLNGIFTIVKKTEKGFILATDPIGIFSLYYTKIQNDWNVSDDAKTLKNLNPLAEFNEQARTEFLAGGYVLEDETLFEGIFRIRPGEIIYLKKDGGATRHFYHYFFPKKIYSITLPELKVKLLYKLSNATNRLLKFLNGRTAVIPLSGGYDSRLIACMLKKAGYANVICFTYGREGWETQLSRQTAEKLDFPWVFINYEEADPGNFPEDPEFKKWCDFGGNAASMPYLQEYFAAKFLKEKKLIPEDSVILPGHPGDFLAGKHLIKSIGRNTPIKKLPRKILKNYFDFIFLKRKARKKLKKRIAWSLKPCIKNFLPEGNETFPINEDWDIKAKRSRFIFNSSLVFPFFGYPFYFPLWDKELRGFFRQLPFRFRQHKLLYDQVLENEYFKPFGVFFEKQEMKVKPGDLLKLKVKRLLLPLVPWKIRKRRLIENDNICYFEFTRILEDQLKKEGIRPFRKFNSFNAVICFWYMKQIEKESR